MFLYDPDKGSLTWKTKPYKGRVKVGDRVGNDWNVVKISQRNYKTHRIIWKMMTGEDPGKSLIDHIDGDSQNNKWDNLRLANHSQNSMNRKKFVGNLKKGVQFENRTQKFYASIKMMGKKCHLGTFETEQEAHQAYIDASNEFFGDYARHE